MSVKLFKKYTKTDEDSPILKLEEEKLNKRKINLSLSSKNCYNFTLFMTFITNYECCVCKCRVELT